MILLQRGEYYPRPTREYQTTHKSWAYINARRLTAGCTMAPILVVHSRYSTTISEGVAWERVSDGLYKTPTKVFPRRASLAAPKAERPTFELRPVELPRLARPMSCFAAFYARSIDELSGRTTGRLGYDRPDLAYAIGGTAELTRTTILQRVSGSDDRTKALISDNGPSGAAGARATLPHPPDQQDRSTGLRAGRSSE